MFLEMAKDMPRARTDALARLWVPMVAVFGVALVLTLGPLRGSGKVRDHDHT